jgi:hypothetical protein
MHRAVLCRDACACRLEVPGVVEDTPPTPAPPASPASKCAIRSYDVDHIEGQEHEWMHMHACKHQDRRTCM